MKTKRHIILYVIAGLWNLTVCWPAILLIRWFWGEHLRWERNPDPKRGDGPSLWCNLKKDSWPTRTWFRQKVMNSTTGKKGPHELPEYLRSRYGRWRTWGAFTLGHGGFYGPGSGDPTGWTEVQEHEHEHVEGIEVAVTRGFWVGAYSSAPLFGLGHWGWGLAVLLFNLWSAPLWIGIANVVAWLRGEDPYRGAEHEEKAYDRGTLFEQERERNGAHR